jgi:uncharacterized membrane protein
MSWKKYYNCLITWKNIQSLLTYWIFEIIFWICLAKRDWIRKHQLPNIQSLLVKQLTNIHFGYLTNLYSIDTLLGDRVVLLRPIKFLTSLTKTYQCSIILFCRFRLKLLKDNGWANDLEQAYNSLYMQLLGIW